jgi:serine protease AprX
MRRSPRALLLALLVPAVLAAPSATAAPAAGGTSQVVVQGPAAAQAVRDAGGTVTRALPIVDGVAATVPTRALPRLERAAGVRAVTPDAKVTVQGAASESNPQTINHVLNREIGADELHERDITGAGVTVALVDTGIADEAYRAGGPLAGRVRSVADPMREGSGDDMPCVNFSGETGTTPEQACDDTFGHGTFMAGLIAGNGAGSEGRYLGVAPQAQLISVKIAGEDGSADVSKVLAAIQWVVSFSDRYDIEVLNLSLGTNSRAPYTVDPLNLAVQRAWTSGLTVVVSASNTGPGRGTITKPADDPLVLTVGAVDDRQTPGTSDDRLPRFSGRGPAFAGVEGLEHAKPDVVAPGGRVISLVSPDSTIEKMQTARGVAALPGGYRRGSGTSMAAAVTSGLTALLLQAKPDWGPDQVKHALMSTAVKVATDDVEGVGRGLVHGPSALKAGTTTRTSQVRSSGAGTIKGSRGDVRVVRSCATLVEACTVQGQVVDGDETSQTGLVTLFDGKQYATGDWSGSSWYASQWAGSSWYANQWLQGSSWYGSSWYGSSWYGNEDATFYGADLQGSSWYGAWE